MDGWMDRTERGKGEKESCDLWLGKKFKSSNFTWDLGMKNRKGVCLYKRN